MFSTLSDTYCGLLISEFVFPRYFMCREESKNSVSAATAAATAAAAAATAAAAAAAAAALTAAATLL